MRRRVLPARCRVYDLANYASEVATHHAEPNGAWQLQAYLGKLIADEYDLEGTARERRLRRVLPPGRRSLNAAREDPLPPSDLRP